MIPTCVQQSFLFVNVPGLLQGRPVGDRWDLETLREWICVYCRGMVEYDAEGFTKLTLLLMWKDFCFLVHGRKVAKHTHTDHIWDCTVTLCSSFSFYTSPCLCPSLPRSGSPAVLPQRPAHPHLPVGIPLHQQWSALLSGAEVVSLQPSLGWQWDGKEGQVCRCRLIRSSAFWKMCLFTLESILHESQNAI